MRLEVGSVHIEDVRFGTRTAIEDHTLTIDRNQLVGLLAADPAFDRVDVELAHPGDTCRIVNIHDVVEPRYRLEGPNFPGALDPIGLVGEGHTRALQNLLVVACDASPGHEGERPGGMLDMAGPATHYSPFGGRHLVALIPQPTAGVDVEEYRLAVTRAGLQTAVYLAAAGKNALPDETAVYELPPLALNQGPPKLPRVAHIFHIHSQQRITQLKETVFGPAFEAGRYGVACAALCTAAQEQLGIQAIAGMDQENPGADIYHQNVYIIPSGRSAAQMVPVLQRMVRLGQKLVAGEPLGRPAEEGYIPRGIVQVGFAEIPAAERVVDMLLAKLRGEPFETEVVPLKFQHAPPADPVPDLASAVIALVTDGGLVPEGNPDRMESSGARRFSALPIAGLEGLSPAEYDVYHSGCDTTYTNRDPHRLVPLDVMRELEREGRFGKLHEYLYSTAGIGADVESSTRTGQGIAASLKAAGVDGVILTST